MLAEYCLFMMKTLVVGFFFSFFLIAAKTPSGQLQRSVQGTWRLVQMSCNGVSQTLDKTFTLSFDGEAGAYVSKTNQCTQTEPEIYRYLSNNTLSIKSGVRACAPNPCAADLPESECGKETNPHAALFTTRVLGNRLTLTTSDPKAIDCTGPGQAKPALFEFERIDR